MILYMDSSAIVKQYAVETGSAEVHEAVEKAEVVGTASISRAEVVAALRKAVRLGVLAKTEGESAVRSFNKSWPDLIRTRVTERLVKHASELAWNHNLRGYDSVQLASAAAWQQAIGRHVTLATFDRRLGQSARHVGLLTFPERLQE
jgi:predicted nucleic acid-binding protein